MSRFGDGGLIIYITYLFIYLFTFFGSGIPIFVGLAATEETTKDGPSDGIAHCLGRFPLFEQIAYLLPDLQPPAFQRGLSYAQCFCGKR